MKTIQNAKLANRKLNTIHGPVQLDAKGQATIEDDVAEHFRGIPGYNILEEGKTQEEIGEERIKKLNDTLKDLTAEERSKVLKKCDSVAIKANAKAIAEKQTHDAAGAIADEVYLEAAIQFTKEAIENRESALDLSTDIPKSEIPKHEEVRAEEPGEEQQKTD